MTINISLKKILKIGHIALLVAIFALLVWSKPWSNSLNSSERTIRVTGQSTIKAVPDEFTFSPYFEEKGADQGTIKDRLTSRANSSVEKLKELGVDEKDITLDASSYDRWYFDDNDEGTLTIVLAIVVSDTDLVQKVQDYLLTLDVKGQISPRATFSEEKRKELDARAVEEASNDAKAKAEVQANLFNTKLGKALKITQGSDSIFYAGENSRAVTLEATEGPDSPSLPVLPGQNKYTQTMTVTYELR